MAKAKQSPRGIEAGAVYPQQEFCDRMGWGRKAFVSARRRGLPVTKESRRVYVLGDEAIQWMRSRKPAVAV